MTNNTGNILILGAGREGRSSYSFLRRFWPELQITLTDDEPNALSVLSWPELNQDPKLKAVKPTALHQLSEFDLTMVSPGIPPKHPILERINHAQLPTSSNSDLFIRSIKGGAQPFPAPLKLTQDWQPAARPKLIGVTGTKGKSTTTSLIQHVLQSNGINCLLGGNIGRPLLDLWDELTAQTQAVAIELSSHQCQQLTVGPDLAVVQAITSEHLDYYASTANYWAAKTHLLTVQASTDQALVLAGDEGSEAAATHAKAALAWFGPALAGQVTKHQLVAELSATQFLIDHQVVAPLNTLQLMGRHNQLNALPALWVGHQWFGLSAQQLTAALASFAPLPHRTEVVATINQVTYINDSLATTPEAAAAALQSLIDRPICLIAGGYDRGIDLMPLVTQLNLTPPQALILLPTTGPKLAELWQKHQVAPVTTIVRQVPDLPTAVQVAQQVVQVGGIVLLSPAAASFNQYHSYAERGDHFKQLVAALAPKSPSDH